MCQIFGREKNLLTLPLVKSNSLHATVQTLKLYEHMNEATLFRVRNTDLT